MKESVAATMVKSIAVETLKGSVKTGSGLIAKQSTTPTATLRAGTAECGCVRSRFVDISTGACDEYQITLALLCPLGGEALEIIIDGRGNE